MINSTATTNLDNLFADIETAFNAAAAQERKTRAAIAKVKAEVLAEIERFEEEEKSFNTESPDTTNPSVLEQIESAEAAGARAAEMLTAIEDGTYIGNADIEEDIESQKLIDECKDYAQYFRAKKL